MNNYPKESAGKKATLNVPTCHSKDSIKEVRAKIIENSNNIETFNYVYVLNDEKKLKGIFSIKRLFSGKDNLLAEEIMDKNIVFAHPYTDQERVAVLAIKNNIKAVPVIKKDGIFLGVVPSDTILDILHQEHTEDMLLSAGIYKKDNFSDASAGALAKIRLPWLIVGLFGGIIAAQIITYFESTLSEKIILASFIPLILYISNSVAIQTQTLYIRNLAMSTFSQKNYFLKELKVSLIIGLVLSSIIFLAFIATSQGVLIATILSTSILITITIAIFMATTITWTLFKIKMDPALGSGPFGTIITDITSLLIYFFVASVFLSYYI